MARGCYLPALSRSHRQAAAYKHRQANAFDELYVPMSLHSPQQQGDVCAETVCCKRLFSSVLNVLEVCYKCFIRMLQK
jgi:hypothetical protein